MKVRHLQNMLISVWSYLLLRYRFHFRSLSIYITAPKVNIRTHYRSNMIDQICCVHDDGLNRRRNLGSCHRHGSVTNIESRIQIH